MSRKQYPKKHEANNKKIPIKTILTPILVIALIAITIILVHKQAKYLIHKSADATVRFFPNQLQESQIQVSPQVYTSQVTVEIDVQNLAESGMVVEYVLLDVDESLEDYEGEWETYEGEFPVIHNCDLYARYARYDGGNLAFAGRAAKKKIRNIAVAGIEDSLGKLKTYETLSDAIDECKNVVGVSPEKEIEILADINLGTITPENGCYLSEITENANIVIDLNGHEIILNEEDQENTNLYIIKNSGKLKIKDSGLPDEDSILSRPINEDFPIDLASFLNIETEDEEETVGKISSKNSNVIINLENGELTILKGIIEATGENGTAITVNGGKLTLGINNNISGQELPDVNKEEPSIYGSLNGIKVNYGTFNFYDGKIKCNDGAGSPVIGKISDIPNGYGIQNTIITENEKTIQVVVLKEKAIFKDGPTINSIMKTLIGDSNTTYSDPDYAIKAIQYSENIDEENKVLVSTSNSPLPIYMWSDIDNGIIYWYSEDQNPYLNSSSRHMFDRLKGLENLDLSNCDTSKVTDMSCMFYECNSLRNINLSGFDTSKLITLNHTFYNCSSIEEIDLTSFDTSEVYDMRGTFKSCTKLQTIYVGKEWSTSKASESNEMFNKCTNLVGGAGTVCYGNNTSKNQAHIDEGVQNPGYLTGKVILLPGNDFNVKIKTIARDENPTIDTVNTSITKIKYSKTIEEKYKKEENKLTAEESTLPMYAWFEDGTLYLWCLNNNNVFPNKNSSNLFKNMQGITSLSLDNWHTDYVENLTNMFSGCTNLEQIFVDKYWNVDNREIESTNMFYNCTNLAGTAGTTYSSENTNKTYAHIDQGEANPGYLSTHAIFDTGKNVNIAMKKLFGWSNPDSSTNVAGITSIEYSEDVNEENMVTVSAADSVVPIYMWSDTSNGKIYWYSADKNPYLNKDASYMFSYLTGLENVDINKFNTSKVRSMSYMFNYCNKIKNIDFKNFETSNVTSMNYMFNYCSSIVSIDLTSFDTSRVTSMEGMFHYCTNLYDVDLTSFDTSSLITTNVMFCNCSKLKLLDLSSFNTAKVTNVTQMFVTCPELTTVYVGNNWNIANSNQNSSIFSGCTDIVGGAGTVYTSSNVGKTYTRIDKGAGEPGYLTAKVILLPGEEFNVKIKAIAGDENPTTETENYTIKKIKYSNTINNEYKKEERRVSANESVLPVYAWYEDETIYLWCENNKLFFNKNSSSMYKNLKALTNLDLTKYNSKEAKDTSNMFSGCTNLADIWVDIEWKTEQITESENMFNNCTNIVGISGTTYSSENTDKIYARVDWGTENPGYLSGSATFNTGKNVNAAIKKIFGGTSATYETTNTTIKQIRYSSEIPEEGKVLVSTLRSPAPIYVWGDTESGRIYWYSPYEKPYLNKDSSYMFSELEGLTYIDLLPFNSSKVTNMDSMFNYCKSIQELNFDNFNTEKVTDMRDMFYYCSSLGKIDISTFNTQRVTSMRYMFCNCSKLTTIYVENKWSTASDTPFMFSSCSNIMGGQGTTYDDNKIYARIDRGVSNPGYFTYRPKFISGEELNIKMKELAGDSNPTVDTVNTTIKQIKQSKTIEENYKRDEYKVSAANSLLPIYMWYNEEEETIYWWGEHTQTELNVNSSNMYKNLDGVTKIDMSDVFTKHTENMSNMFSGCTNLKEIWVGEEWNTNNVTNSTDMFKNCNSIVGMGETPYSSEHIDIEYAHVDNGEQNPGYLWGHATFDVGANVNVKIKKLFGDSSATYSTTNTTIKGFMRSENVDIENSVIVSSSKSLAPIYVWKDAESGIAYWYSIDKNPYLNEDTSCMFYEMQGITNIDLSSIKTERSMYMNHMFYNCVAAKNINTSSFDTKRVTTMKSMYLGCNSLKHILLNHFNTANVKNMSYMFENCGNLYSIDIRSFDTKKVKDATEMFSGCTTLTNIYIGKDWTNSNISSSTYMFRNCVKLVGGAGTVFGGSVDRTYARADKGSTEPGYLTGEAVFETGEYVNIKMKELSGDLLPTVDTVNDNIKAIQYSQTIDDEYKDDRYKVSAENSFLPIYMWYDEESETMYWWSESKKTILNDDCSNMFANLSELKKLDYIEENARYVVNMSNMFNGCTNLEEIWVGYLWETAQVEESTNMFNNCTSLVGISGTAYSSEHTDKEYARIDKGISNPGYFSARAIFNTGTNMNIAMKKLSGDTNPTASTANTRIKKIVYSDGVESVAQGNKVNVSASNSLLPIYMWADTANGIIYWHSYDQRPYINEDSSYMFQAFQTLENMEFSKFDMSGLKNISYMFNGCSKIEDIDFTNIDTPILTNASYAFQNCQKVLNINLASLDTKKVGNMYHMFYNCNNLSTIYVSDKWSTASCSSDTEMFYNCANIVGGAGTVYNSSKINKSYACIDRGSAQPGYLTGIHIFKTGEFVNIKMKELVQDVNPTLDTINTSIKQIKYSSTIPELYKTEDNKVSTSDSTLPIYMWYNEAEETIYWWCEANKPILNVDCSSMFKNLSGLTTLDLSIYSARTVTNMCDMFNGCTQLTEIWIGPNWRTDKVTSSTNMFNNCTNIVGMNGTTYNGGHVDVSYAHVDDGEISPGYLSGRARFDTGVNVNAAMKRLSGQASGNTSTTNYSIHEVVYTESLPTGNKEIVSSGDSPTPIYMWMNTSTGTIYWHSADRKAYLNENSVAMFKELRGLTSLDTRNFDASRVKTMAEWLYYCEKLNSVNFKGINTQNNTSMNNMFYACMKLEVLDLTDFDTRNVTDTYRCFINCYAQKIYVGNKWNVSRVTSASQMFSGCSYLVGGKGTGYNSSNVGLAYARIDRGTSAPGYLTYRSTLKTGEFINVKMKALAGDENPTVDTVNTSIKAVLQADTIAEGHKEEINRISTDDSLLPAYIWYDEDKQTIYWWSEHNEVSLNADSSSMFKNLSEVTEIDIQNVYSKDATNMSNMFSGCTNVNKIWVGIYWSAEQVTESSNMFNNCNSLEGIAGTTYNAAYKDKTYALADGGETKPGYLSGHAVFTTGESLNNTMKKISGHSNISWANFGNLIKGIEYSTEVDEANKVLVSSSDSLTPIYM